MLRVLLLASIASLMFASTARAQSCPGASGWVFDDVLASDPFCGYITWAAQNGVSLGCQIIDANHRLYCPNADVPRSQMAAFLNRAFDMPDSTAAGVGTITKPGGAFLHNYRDGTFLGVGAGNFTMTGTGNTAVGLGALTSVTTGVNNAAFGIWALHANTTGYANVAIGPIAMFSNTTGSGNTTVGGLEFNTTGQQNTAVGNGAMGANQTGSFNTALGASALVLNTEGNFNVALGDGAMYSNTASRNVAVGDSALLRNTTGERNLALGSGAGQNLIAGSFNIEIGTDGAADDDRTIRVGDVNQTRAFIAAIRGVTTGMNDAVNVIIDSNGQLGTISSSRDAKDRIADMKNASAALMQLRPVTFYYKSDGNPAGPRLQYGLVAEEVAEVYPGIVATKDGKPETVMYQYLAPMLLNEFQKQQRTIESQARELVAEREARVAQTQEIAELKRAVEALIALMTENRLAAK